MKLYIINIGCYISGRTAQSTRESFQKVGFEILLDEDVFEKIAGSDYNFHESLEDANGYNIYILCFGYVKYYLQVSTLPLRILACLSLRVSAI
jgi:hypothetical protein